MTEKLKNPFKINELITAVNELDTNKQDILVSGTNIKTINNTSILGSGNINVESGANTSLSNLTSQGQNIANWSTNVTNCITEIPQDISLMLDSANNRTILKAGSKVYVPNGFESNGTTRKFTEYVVPNDIINSDLAPDTGTRLLYLVNQNTLVGISASTSGTTAPTSSGNNVFYNTSTNTIRRYMDGTEQSGTYSFPIAIVTANGTYLISKIDQVFNGFGYIGSTVFALPGVKGLIPNGRNEDGTLKNIEFTTSSVLTSTQEVTGWNGKWSLYLNASFGQYHPTELEYVSDTKPTSVYTTTAYWYSPLDNKLYFTQDTGATWTQSDELHCIDYTENSSKITSITPKIVFRIADDNTAVHKTGDETISGTKTFIGIQYLSPQTLITKENNSDEGGQITFEKAINSTLKGNPYIDVYQDTMRFITIDNNNNVHFPLTINCNDGTFTSGTFQVVSTLPANPNANVYYFIPE